MKTQEKITIQNSIGHLPYVNEKLEKLLEKLGIKTIEDLLFYAPSRYLDFSNIVKIRNVSANETFTICGQIISINNKKTWRKKITITEAVLRDDSGSIKAVWFNQPFLTRNFKVGDVLNLSGKAITDDYGFHLQNPIYEKMSSGKSAGPFIHTAGLAAIYPETAGLTSRWLRFLMKHSLKYAMQIPETIPQEIKTKENFLPIKDAIINLHFPKSPTDAEKSKKQLAFRELLFVQFSVFNFKKQIKSQKAPTIKTDLESVKKFISLLPFELTNAQKKSAWQILKDLEKPHPMNRLLNGDVGSGKTIVAAIAALNTAKNNGQVAYLAPTEILARQHFQTFCKFLKPFNLNISLSTGSENKIFDPELNQEYKTTKSDLLEKINENKINIAIGTHALIQDKVKFSNLNLVIIDEQHRFGVNQRVTLLQNSKIFIPHLLSMTATPIPRTLMLTAYGDLDISILNELPPGRQKIITRIITLKERNKAYDFIKNEIKNGRQAFVICPRIEQATINYPLSDFTKSAISSNEIKTVKEEYKKLSEEIFPDLKIAIMHGKLKPKEKERVMEQFSNGAIDILVSTSVIEVGIDIPNATIMMIEGAERFGLAQLHQFRGRIGRGKHQSYCFLMTDSSDSDQINETANNRLEALVNSADGFKLAQYDLELRGPGEFLGTRQSGMADLTFASFADIFLIEKVRNYAADIFKKDPNLYNYPAIKNQLKKFQQKIHLE